MYDIPKEITEGIKVKSGEKLHKQNWEELQKKKSWDPREEIQEEYRKTFWKKTLEELLQIPKLLESYPGKPLRTNVLKTLLNIAPELSMHKSQEVNF